MRRGRRGHPCEVPTQIGLWRCPECGQQWEIHGIEGNPQIRKVSRVGWFVAKLLG
ncbi:hypothetical protein [Saccharopolyspora dendranthemae]|uniref:Uncharacterized protein n=1 Tax=Saccharopolyspora dendranthemae TaxID=1181886 RepID=A0A561U9H2_9PSEU|nr:hypothetical protein [Saccharopolyspora dendranthemae]TWF96002.1 hypothetical protein FHU35_121003 [Saccharopolyspora dendranthemae]